MQTLQEYLVFTKGWEYIITILFVFTFMVFWAVVNRRRAR